jgi:hypothetical protein
MAAMRKIEGKRESLENVEELCLLYKIFNKHKTLTIDQENGVKDERLNKLRIKLQSDPNDEELYTYLKDELLLNEIERFRLRCLIPS